MVLLASHTSSPNIPFLRFLSSLILHCFPLVVFIFQFSKGMLSSTSSHCKKTSSLLPEILFLITPFNLFSWPILCLMFRSQLPCIYLLRGLPDHPFSPPVAPRPYPSLSHSLAVVLNKGRFWPPTPTPPKDIELYLETVWVIKTGEGATGIWWIETKDAVKHHKRQLPKTKINQFEMSKCWGWKTLLCRSRVVTCLYLQLDWRCISSFADGSPISSTMPDAQ